ncbi:7f6b3818-494f-49ec-b553-0b71eea472bb [Thermothielavioides terrestris]|uniref:7f6b3818-494f-49ec-b553-0b71eea472bb n=1 Tax=Thermothielavioides terrestris TaxID=2587410 RepID=A0A446BAT6_9PEZI|nr:7f6b3818-494f-49ec-b553-0b71eea472bb [Thermothielavioides terrestris]
MGNAQSIEAPRRTRASQKLSKPKTGNHATAGLLSPSSFSYSSRRLSSAQLPNPPAAPSLPVVSTPTTSSAVEGSGAFVRRADSGASLHSSPSLPRESRRRSLFRSRSSRAVADSLEPSHNAAASGAWIVDRFTRTNSMTYESAIAHYGHVGPDNWPFEPGSRTSWNYNLSSYEAKRLLNLYEQPGLERVAAMAENKMTVITETTWKSSNPAQPPSALITRTSSDASLCMPVRRRSIVQTPGVATRSNSVRDLPPLPQLNFRHSHPPTPSLSRQPSVESYRSGIRSMPPPIQDPDAQPRAVTPCEDKYLSIGAFKLGSLRITNGSPSTVTSENQRSQKEERSSAGNDAPQDGYFSGAQGRETCVTSTAATRDLPQSPPFLPEISRSPPWSPIQSDLASPSLQTTSKVTALEDKLFDDEAQPEYSSPEVLDIRLDPNAKPLRPPLERDTGSTITRTDNSRDSIQSYAAMQTLASKTSVDSLRSYASSQPGVGNSSVHSRLPSVVSMDPRRLQSFRQRHSPQSPPYDSPNWEVQTENGMVRSRSQTSAASGSRRNSISSVHSEGIYRPVSIQEWQFRAAQQQPLRHRASYDGYSYQQRFPQRGYPPSMSNGYTAPVKPAYDPRSRRQLDAAATWSRSQVDAAAGQWYQDGRLPPYAPVPRGHYRNRSVGAWSVYGVNPPYRVLHSYNSPAYRNVPIWG